MGLVPVDFGEGLHLADLALDVEGAVLRDGGLGEGAADDVLDEVPLQVAHAVEHFEAHVTGLEFINNWL